MNRLIIVSLMSLTAAVVAWCAYYLSGLPTEFWTSLTWSKMTDLFFLCMSLFLVSLQMANLSFHKIHL